MFWKKFRQSLSANKVSNQAKGQWRQSQRFLLEGNQKAADESCVEALRLCQIAIEHDRQHGDAYILLANVLMAMAFQVSEPSRHDYLLSRAMAVIHLWHSLPYRKYPVSKNARIGEQIWTTAVQELVNSKSVSETAAISLLDSYRDNLATEVISPRSFDNLKGAILGDAFRKQILCQRMSEDALTPQTRHFLTDILPQVLQRKQEREQSASNRSFSPETFLDSLKYGGGSAFAVTEVYERVREAFHNNDFREVIEWLAWLYLLCILQESLNLGPAYKETLAQKSKAFGDILATAVHKARERVEKIAYGPMLFSRQIIYNMQFCYLFSSNLHFPFEPWFG